MGLVYYQIYNLDSKTSCVYCKVTLVQNLDQEEAEWSSCDILALLT